MDANGRCSSCISGSKLYNGTCVSLPTINPFCSNFNGTNCISCQNGYYLGIGICIPSNPYCLTYDMISGFCLSCNIGYTLFGSLCIISQPCLAFGSLGGCLICPSGYVAFDTTCATLNTVNPLCLTFSGQMCTSCFNGYFPEFLFTLTSTPSSICLPTYPLCGPCNILSLTCTICTSDWCILSNPNCNTVASDGSCLSCNQGHALWNGNCVFLSFGNIFCTVFDGVTCTCPFGFSLKSGICTIDFSCSYPIIQSCLACMSGYTFFPSYAPFSIGCLKTSPLCAVIDVSGNCISCF